jgi:biotin carboxyl carrier protein
MNRATINIAEYSFEYDESRGIITNSNGKNISADVKKISECEFSVLVEGKSFHIFFSTIQNLSNATVNNFLFDIQKETFSDKLNKKLHKESANNINSITLRAPMPGLITKILLSEGAAVIAGEGVLIVEAMKMENEIKSMRSGILKKIFVQEKQTVEKNDPLFTIE